MQSVSERTKCGKLIAIEGVDGAGTTTQAAELVSRLAKRDIPAKLTKEPSDGSVGQLLRKLLADDPQPRRVMAMLFGADREDHLARFIEPHLREGTNVVTDRYTLSTLAYQAENYGSQVLEASGPMHDISIRRSGPMTGDSIKWLIDLFRETRQANMTVFLSVDPETTRERIGKRELREVYETDDEQARIRRNYSDLVRLSSGAIHDIGQGIVVVDGNGTIEQVADRVEVAVLNLLWGQFQRAPKRSRS